MTYMVRVGGVHGTEIGEHSPVVYETLADGGCGIASWAWNLPPYAYPRGATEGAIAEVFESGHRVYYGRVEHVDRETWGVRCRGMWRDGDRIPNFDGTLNTTRDVAAALAGATSLPWSWAIRSDGITGTIDGDSQEPMTITKMLSMLADKSGYRVGVTAGGRLYLRPDPTEPKWIIRSADIVLSSTDLDDANVYVGRYYDGSTHHSVLSGTPTAPASAEIVDLSEHGTLSALDASAIVTQIAALTAKQKRWTNAITVHRSQITNMGGTSAPFESVLGGDMARIMCVSDAQRSQTGAPYIDAVLGRVVCTSGSDTIQIEPVGARALTLEDALKQVAAA